MWLHGKRVLTLRSSHFWSSVAHLVLPGSISSRYCSGSVGANISWLWDGSCTTAAERADAAVAAVSNDVKYFMMDDDQFCRCRSRQRLFSNEDEMIRTMDLSIL